jgi:hypothetical protein
MNHKASLLIAAASVLLGACASQVIDGGGLRQGGSDDAVQMGGAGGAGVRPEPASATPAVAMTRARLDQLWEEYWQNQEPSGSTTSSGGDLGLDPNDLFLRVSDLGASCRSPTTELTCGGHWQVSLVLPVGYQRVGLYDLADPAITQYSSMSETGEPYSPAPGDCSWGGGSLIGGTLEILSIDQAEVRFRLVIDTFWDSDPSGEYTAPRCP